MPLLLAGNVQPFEYHPKPEKVSWQPDDLSELLREAARQRSSLRYVWCGPWLLSISRSPFYKRVSLFGFSFLPGQIPARLAAIRRDRSFRFKKRDLRSNERERERKRLLRNSKFKIQKSTAAHALRQSGMFSPGFESKFYLQSF